MCECSEQQRGVDAGEMYGGKTEEGGEKRVKMKRRRRRKSLISSALTQETLKYSHEVEQEIKY